MYVVILGDLDSALGEEDFTVYGPFASETDAQNWAAAATAANGNDPLDMPIVVELYSSADYLQDQK